MHTQKRRPSHAWPPSCTAMNGRASTRTRTQEKGSTRTFTPQGQRSAKKEQQSSFAVLVHAQRLLARAHMLARSSTEKKTTPRIHAHTRTGRWDGEIVVLPQGCVGPAHLAAFHVHLCVRAERLLHALCSNMGSPWSAEHVLSCSTFDEQPRASTSAAISFADARAQAWDGSIIDAAARQWVGVADKLVCSLMALIHLDGGERNGGGGGGEKNHQKTMSSFHHVFHPPASCQKPSRTKRAHPLPALMIAARPKKNTRTHRIPGARTRAGKHSGARVRRGRERLRHGPHPDQPGPPAHAGVDTDNVQAAARMAAAPVWWQHHTRAVAPRSQAGVRLCAGGATHARAGLLAPERACVTRRHVLLGIWTARAPLWAKAARCVGIGVEHVCVGLCHGPVAAAKAHVRHVQACCHCATNGRVLAQSHGVGCVACIGNGKHRQRGKGWARGGGARQSGWQPK